MICLIMYAWTSRLIETNDRSAFVLGASVKGLCYIEISANKTKKKKTLESSYDYKPKAILWVYAMTYQNRKDDVM